MTKINPRERISACEALSHDWITKYAEVCEEMPDQQKYRDYLEK